MEFFDTTEAGGGSYPSPPRTYVKQYTLKLNGYFEAEVEVQATSLEEAEDEIRANDLLGIDYDLDFKKLELEEITCCKIEELD